MIAAKHPNKAFIPDALFLPWPAFAVCEEAVEFTSP